MVGDHGKIRIDQGRSDELMGRSGLIMGDQGDHAWGDQDILWEIIRDQRRSRDSREIRGDHGEIRIYYGGSGEIMIAHDSSWEIVGTSGRVPIDYRCLCE